MRGGEAGGLVQVTDAARDLLEQLRHFIREASHLWKLNLGLHDKGV